MLSMPFAEDEAAKVATKKHDAAEAEAGDEGNTSKGPSEGGAYAFEGYQIEFSERVSLTPMGVPAAPVSRSRP